MQMLHLESPEPMWTCILGQGTQCCCLVPQSHGLSQAGRQSCLQGVCGHAGALGAGSLGAADGGPAWWGHGPSRWTLQGRPQDGSPRQPDEGGALQAQVASLTGVAELEPGVCDLTPGGWSQACLKA